MTKKVQPAASQPTELPKPPFSVGDRGAFIRKAFVAVNVVNVPTYECVTYSIAYNRVETVHIPVSEMAVDQNGRRTQFYVDGNHTSFGPNGLAKTHLEWLRIQALKDGATPEAIRLLGAIKPFTKKEELEMAEKLKAKGAAKADTDGLKAAAKKTPVGGNKSATGEKKKGNADALKKAREAKGPDLRKIKPLIKAKDIAARPGTYRHQMVTDLLNSKTVAEFREKNAKYHAGDLRYAIDANIISVS